MTKKFKDMKGVIAIATTPFNNENEEFETAINEIHKIAQLRIKDLSY